MSAIVYRYSYSEEETSVQSEDIPPMNDPVSATRVLCGALLLPTIASLCGRLFFESISSNFQRTLLVHINSSNYYTKIDLSLLSYIYIVLILLLFIRTGWCSFYNNKRCIQDISQTATI